MTFRTTCPACASVFRLDAVQLDAAQGWVQCGVCGATFDTHPSLLMEDGSPLVVELEPVAEPATSEPPLTPHDPDEAGVIAQAAPPVVVVPSGIAQRETALELPSIILIDPDIPVPDDPGPLPQFDPEPAPPAASIYSEGEPLAARIEYAQPLPEPVAVVISAPRYVKSWVWGLGSTVLLLLLLAQTSYFMRDSLVARWPQARPAFEQVCAALGCTLSLPQNRALLKVNGSDLQIEASGRLKLILNLENRANHVQAWPMLVLTLTDQRERALARRSFAPSEYLADPQRIAAGMPPRSEQPLSLPLTVRDIAPMGFELELSY